MAKKEKAPDAEGEKPEGDAAEAAPKKGFRKFLTKKILMIAVPALVLVLGGGGAGAYFFLIKKAETHEAKAEEEVLRILKLNLHASRTSLSGEQTN